MIDEAKNRPTPKMLFKSVWPRRELCIPIFVIQTRRQKVFWRLQIANQYCSGGKTYFKDFKMEA